jgi:hypothetical protein
VAVIQVNVSALNDLVERLRTVGPAAVTRLSTKMEQAGELVAASARDRASFSTKIPGSIHVEMAGTVVRVSTSLDEAVAIENGGKGRVRHPLFGNRNFWFTKNSPPAFLHPALNDRRAEVYDLAVEAIHEAFVEAGMGT